MVFCPVLLCELSSFCHSQTLQSLHSQGLALTTSTTLGEDSAVAGGLTAVDVPLLHPLVSPVTLRRFGPRQLKCVTGSHVKIFQRRNFCLILASGSLTQGFASEDVPESCFTMMQPMRSGRKLSR